jgi:hypothetical protein
MVKKKLARHNASITQRQLQVICTLTSYKAFPDLENALTWQVKDVIPSKVFLLPNRVIGIH